MLPTILDPIPLPWATRLIERMRMMYGAKFTQQWEGIDPANLTKCWAEELAGFTAEELRRGVDVCRSRDWPPTLPEFMKMCRPGIQPEAAYHEAVAGVDARERGLIGTWTHPAIYWAAIKIGRHDLINHGYPAMRLRWERALRDEFAKGQWPEIPTPAKALPAPGATETTSEDGLRRIAELNPATALKPMAGGGHRRWIGKLLDREKGKHGKPPAGVLAMARRANGLEDGS